MNKKEKGKQKAIEILNKQIGKLDDSNYIPEPKWPVQTGAYIREYFGEDSDQYEFIRRFKFRAFGTGMEEFNKNKAAAKRFINESIQLIENKGLYSPPKENFILRIDNASLITLTLGVLGIIGTGCMLYGKRISDVQNIRLEEMVSKQKDSLTNSMLTNDSLKKVIITLRRKVMDTSNHSH